MKKFILIISACGLLIGCANMVAPTGGQKDIEALEELEELRKLEEAEKLEIRKLEELQKVPRKNNCVVIILIT